jgi:hypothetical protein
MTRLLCARVDVGVRTVGDAGRAGRPRGLHRGGVHRRAGGGARRHRLGPGGAGRALPRRRVAVAAVHRRAPRAGRRRRRHLGRGAADRDAAPVHAGRPLRRELGTDEGWAKRNRHAWRRDYRGFVEFFAEMFPELQSTKQVEDCVARALEPAWRPCWPRWTPGPSCRESRSSTRRGPAR